MSTGSATVRPMRLDDIARVREIDQAVYPEVWSEKLLAAEVDRPDRHHVVIELDGAIAGHAGMLFVEPEATLSTIAVDPDVQGRSLATTMLVHLIDVARSRGVEAITLEVRSGNRRAQRMYYRFGFAPVSVRQGYYRSSGSSGREDAVIMWAHDVHTSAYGDRLDGLRPIEIPEKETVTRVG